MTGMPTDALDLHDAATDDSETPATAFNGTGLGAGLNQIIADAEATGTKVGPGSSAPARGKALVGTGQTSGSGKQQSAWDTFARRNRIVNGTGRTKQRTTMPTTDNAYGFDRWRVLMENANGATLTQETSDLPVPGPGTAMKLTVGSGNNGKFGHWQPILFADCRDLAGKSVSLRADLKASNARETNTRMAVAQFTGTADAISGDPISLWGADGTNPTLATNWTFANTPASKAITTSWVTYYVENISISASANNLAVFVWCDARTTTAADYILMTNIQLEEGAVSTTVEIVPEAQERALCRDWLVALSAGATFTPFASGVIQSTSVAEFWLTFPQMRSTPVGSFSANADFQAYDSSATSSGTFTVDNAGRSSARVLMTGGSGLTANRPGILRAANTVSATLTLTAEP